MKVDLTPYGQGMQITFSPQSLDPVNWQEFRQQSHQMLDDILDYIEHIRERPVWQAIPSEIREEFRAGLPKKPSDLTEVHQTFMEKILPYAVGNSHPGFMGWVHGGGNPVGALADMLAAGLNANLGGRDQIPIEVERQITQWMQELFGFPQQSSGLFVTGTSMANLIAVLVARTARLGKEIRHEGVAGTNSKLVAYTSACAHGCIAQAMDLSGLGINALRVIPANKQHQIDTSILKQTIEKDRQSGFTPFLIVGTAGSVGIGAIDPLSELSHIAKQQGLWFHVDGAYGAMAMLSADIAPKLKGIENADSIAFDFHKWAQVPYDAGFILVRDGTLHQNTFSSPAAYLKRETRGLAAGSPWPCDFGPDLSRGFRALKTWFTFQVYGTEKLGKIISNTCRLAHYMKELVQGNSKLDLLAPVELNIVCFQYRCRNADEVNAQIVVKLQESGIVAPSIATINGRQAIRAAIVNHRTTKQDIDNLITQSIAIGDSLTISTEGNHHERATIN